MKRGIRILLLWSCWLAQSVYAAGPLQAGPVYTASKATAHGADGDSPIFPQLQILLDPGDPADRPRPTDLRLTVDAKDCGTAMKLQPFNLSRHGMAVAVTIDVSGSMKGRPLNAIRTGLTRFVDDAGPHDHVAILTVADDSRWDSNWDAPRAALKQSLASLTTRGTLTRLWDGIQQALGSFTNQPPARRLIVISDGHDEGSSSTEERVIALALTQHVPIDTIGITRSNPVYLKALESLSAQTGGHFSQAVNEKQLEQLVGSGIQGLRSLPLASFNAKGVPADGKVHSFRVTWKHGGQDSVASLSSSVPKIPTIMSRYKRWILAASAALLLGGVAFLATRRKRLAPIPVPPASPASPAPPPPPVMRSATMATPPPPRPFVPAASPPRVTPSGKASAPAPAKPPRPSPLLARTQIAPRFTEPTKDHPCAWLLCESGVVEGSELPINAVEFWMGGLGNNHLSLSSDPTVSGNHACIVFDHGALGIFDNASTNGTWVNEQRVAETRQLLWPGDRIRAGRSTFVLTLTPSKPVL